MADESQFGETIFDYTRRQAIADGVLIDVSEMAKEAGIKLPSAVTTALWHQWIVPDEESESAGQSMSGRLWDVLNVFRFVASRQPDEDRVTFPVTSIRKGVHAVDVEIKAVIGAGDQGDPVLTFLLPEED